VDFNVRFQDFLKAWLGLIYLNLCKSKVELSICKPFMRSSEKWLIHKTNAIRTSVSDEIRQMRIILFCNAQVSIQTKSKKPTFINTLRLKSRQL
jgi:hypothetical protein